MLTLGRNRSSGRKSKLGEGGEEYRRRKGFRPRLESLEDILLLATAPIVSSTVPNLMTNGARLVAGVSSIQVNFNSKVTGQDQAANYELRGAGRDATYGTSDDILVGLTVSSFSSTSATLSFAAPPAGDCRFTVHDAITTSGGKPSDRLKLDGDSDGKAGGDFVRTFTIIPGAAQSLTVTGYPSPTTAGATQNFTVTAKDTYGNVATGYTGTVTIASTDPQAVLPARYTFATADAGTKTFSVTLGTPGVQSLTVTDTANSSITGSQTGIQVDAVPVLTASSLDVVGLSSPINLGATGSFTITAKDSSGNVVTGYTGTVTFTSTDPLAVLPANYTFTTADAGTKTFSARLWTLGVQSLTATDVASSSITGSQTSIQVNSPIDASYFVLTGFSSPTPAGTTGSFAVTAKDVNGNVAIGYTGTVTFTSTDPLAVLPANYTFTAADAGTKTFSATLYTAGSQKIIATDASQSTITGQRSSITVTPLAASTLQVTGYPSPTTTGLPQNFTVIARDRYGNQATDYTGTVAFTSTDPLAALPAPFTFTAADNGDKIFSATFKTAGVQSITATDIANSSITGSQTGIQVNQAPVRYASSTNTIYVMDPVTITLSQIAQYLPKAPLIQVDPTNGTWLLKANLVLQNGATLLLHGTSIGGDVNELRLLSDNNGMANSVVRVETNWGTISINTTKITSWDEAANGGRGGPDTEYTTSRAFIRARSYLETDGVTPRESRMDIKNSDIGYLGYDASESYGLSWKVNGDRGAAITDATGNPTYDLYQKVNVYGDIINTHIHNNFFGVFTYGAYGMTISGNEFAHNIGYGLDPHDDSDNLTIAYNVAHDNGYHGIIASQRCDHLVIHDNESYNNGECGFMLHRNSNDAQIYNNYFHDNVAEDGIALFESFRNSITNNRIEHNGNGIRLSVGSSDNVVIDNQVSNNLHYGFKFYQGNDLPTQGDGRPRRNIFQHNTLTGNVDAAINLKDSDSNVFDSNIIDATNGGIYLQRSVDNRFTGNTLPSTVIISTTGDSSIASRTLIDTPQQMSLQVDQYSSVVLNDTGNHIFNLASGGVGTTITPSGSSLTLTQAQLGSTAVLVSTLNFSATPGVGGSATVLPTRWDTSGQLRKAWTTRASSSTLSVSYTVGDLATNTTYIIKKNGVTLLTLTSDASGHLSFSDVAGSTLDVGYSIAPA